MTHYQIYKILFISLGGILGLILGLLYPTFPLLTIAILFILVDAYSAYLLDKRVHIAYPDYTKRHEAKFTSFKLSKVFKETIPTRLLAILLAYAAEITIFLSAPESVKFLHFVKPSWMIAAAVCFELFLSITENASSCRSEKDARLWKWLLRFVVDKTRKHLDDKLTADVDITPEYLDKLQQLLDKLKDTQLKNNS